MVFVDETKQLIRSEQYLSFAMMNTTVSGCTCFVLYTRMAFFGRTYHWRQDRVLQSVFAACTATRRDTQCIHVTFCCQARVTGGIRCHHVGMP